MLSEFYNRRLHVLAWLTAAATFPLIFMGGLVTSHHAGMSVPDWPNSYGYNMFLFPPRLWIGGILYEHTHRLMGTVVGFLAMLLAMDAWGVGRSITARRRWRIMSLSAVALVVATIVLAMIHIASPEIQKLLPHFAVGFASIALIFGAAMLARRRDPRASVRWLALTVLITVCIQGALGGTRVDLVNLTLAIVHGCFAQAFFCLTAAMVVVTSRWWIETGDRSRLATPPIDRWIVAACVLAVIVIYGQLIVGATMRHLGAGLAVSDFPLAYGHVIPRTDAIGMHQINETRAWKLNLPPVSAEQVWLHMSHRIGAAIVSAALLVLATLIFVRQRAQKALFWPAVAVLALLAIQITLGALTVIERKPADIASAHVAVGALTLVTTFVLCIRAFRLYFIEPAARHASSEIDAEVTRLATA